MKLAILHEAIQMDGVLQHVAAFEKANWPTHLAIFKTLDTLKVRNPKDRLRFAAMIKKTILRKQKNHQKEQTRQAAQDLML